MQQKTIFLDFYKTKDYFFDLIIKTKDLCTQYICSWEIPEAYPQKYSPKRINTFLEEHHWEAASETFQSVLHYFSAISPFFQKHSPKETPEAVSQTCSSKKLNTFWEEHIWRTASGTLEIVPHYFLSVQFYSCPHFWQIYLKCFLHTALLASATHFDFGEFIFVFFISFLSSYFCNANVTPISVTSIFHNNACCFWWLCYL